MTRLTTRKRTLRLPKRTPTSTIRMKTPRRTRRKTWRRTRTKGEMEKVAEWSKCNFVGRKKA